MRRKRLNHYADISCKMFVGWRMGNDLEVLSAVPDGTITIDLLTGKDHHSVVGALNLYVSQEIAAWLQHHSNKEGVDWAQMESAILVVAIETQKIATKNKRLVTFNFECKAALCTSEVCYEASLTETVKWHTKIARQNRKTEI